MSDAAGGGESGVAGTGQDAEADNEPPQQAPPLLEGDDLEVGETSEEGLPSVAKRLRMSEAPEQVAEPVEIHGETSAQAGLLLEDPAPPAQSACFSETAGMKSNARKKRINSSSDFWMSVWDNDSGITFQMYSLMLGTGELPQCEEKGRGVIEAPVSLGGEEEDWHENGDGGHDAALEEETKAEEECDANGAADSPSEGQQ